MDIESAMQIVPHATTPNMPPANASAVRAESGFSASPFAPSPTDAPSFPQPTNSPHQPSPQESENRGVTQKAASLQGSLFVRLAQRLKQNIVTLSFSVEVVAIPEWQAGGGKRGAAGRGPLRPAALPSEGRKAALQVDDLVDGIVEGAAAPGCREEECRFDFSRGAERRLESELSIAACVAVGFCDVEPDAVECSPKLVFEVPIDLADLTHLGTKLKDDADNVLEEF